MPKLEASRVIKASRDKVWEVASDPESSLKFDPDTKSVKIIKREGNTVTASTTMMMGGRETTMTEKWTYHPKQRMESEILDGPLVGTGFQTLEEVPGGIKLTMHYDVSFKGVLGKVLGTLFAGSKLKEFAEEFLSKMAKYIEAQK